MLCINCLSTQGQICVECNEREIKMMRVVIDKQMAEMTMENDRSTSNQKNSEAQVNFLRLPFYNDPDDGVTTKSDVTIVVHDRPDEPLHAHKVILAEKSTVFCEMFTSFGNERRGPRGIQTVLIVDVTLPVMQEVIRFCYDGEIMNFDDEVPVEEVLKVAHKYNIKHLGKLCETYLAESLDSDNLSSRLKLAKKLGAEDLRAAALEYFKNHFDEVAGTVFDDLI